MVDTFRIGTNIYNYCDCGQHKIAKAKTCRGCLKQANAKPVVADNVRYESLGRAAVALKISEQLVRYRCKTKTFPHYYYANEVSDE